MEIKEPGETDLHKLLRQMTLEEKVGQLNLLHGAVDADHTAIRTGAVTGYLLGPPRWEKDQAFSWAAQTNALQRIAVEESRLGIPLIFSRDVIHGHRTVFPIPLGQAASFNPELVRECAEIAAREASAQGVHWNYSPMVDIGRDPRWGRVAEGYGEDPYLCSRMAEALVRGYQGADLSSPERIAACVKHFAAYGAPLGGRDYDSVEVSERTLREVYLPPFQAAVRAGAASVMAALHDLNGVPMSINHALLHGVLRTEWGFTGLVVSDWGAVADLLKHRVAGDEAQAAVLALQAGIEMDMVSGLYNKHLVELVRDGTVSLELIDSAVLGVLTLKKKLGLFEHPYVDPEREKTQLLTPANREHARRMAQQSCVLLQNKNSLLPLARDIRSVAVVGPFAESKAELLGTWTLDGQAEDVTSIIEGIRETVSQQTRVIGGGMHPESAVAMAQEADAVIAVLGEHPTRSGEAATFSNIGLPPGQLEMLSQIAQFEIPVVCVVLAGRALAIEPLRRFADAVLYCFHPGIEGGRALADIIFGTVSPSAKLPVTLPRAPGQIPIYYSQRSTGRPPERTARYTTKAIDIPSTPLYPFGWGLSYAQFSYSNLRISPELATDGQSIIVLATITNTSPSPGTETVQLYIRDEVRSTAPPQWELKRFLRIELAAGASSEVAFELASADLGFWQHGSSWRTEPGLFTLRVGPDSQGGITGQFKLLEQN